MLPIEAIHAERVPIPLELKNLASHPATPWKVSDPLFNRSQNIPWGSISFKKCEVLPSDPEFKFVMHFFKQQKPPYYSIKKIHFILNPSLNQMFEAKLKTIDLEGQNPLFNAKLDEPKGEREKTLERWRKISNIFSPLELQESSALLSFFTRRCYHFGMAVVRISVDLSAPLAIPILVSTITSVPMPKVVQVQVPILAISAVEPTLQTALNMPPCMPMVIFCFHGSLCVSLTLWSVIAKPENAVI